MSINLIRSPPFHERRPLRLINYTKRESFHPDGPMFRTPVIGAAPRIAQGLDMSKLVVYPWQPFWKTREKFSDGYKYGERNNQPSNNAMTPEEMATYYNYSNYFSKWTYTELLKIGFTKYFRWWLYFVPYPVVALTILGIYFLPSNRYESIEYFMPVEEYYENYVWHDFGKFIDKKAYEQYLEARRAKKWTRNPDVNPIDYIPAIYRSEKQKIARGEIRPPAAESRSKESLD